MWEFRAKKTDRLDRVLREERNPGAEWLSRQAWDWLFENGGIYVSGRKVGKAGAEVESGTAIRVELPGPLGLCPGTSLPTLLWASPARDLALFAKAPGIATLPLLPWDHSTFANQVAAFVEKEAWMPAPAFAALAEAPRLEGGVLQRLDRDTSGILAVAFTAEAKALFRKLFSQSLVTKTYLAIVEGPNAKLEGSHRVWLSSGGGAKVGARLAAPKMGGEPSVLRVTILASAGVAHLVGVQTSQGERHVVRAGMAALGFPLLGDALYGGSARAPFHQLHAWSMEVRSDAYPGFPSGLKALPPQSFLDSLTGLGLHFTG